MPEGSPPPPEKPADDAPRRSGATVIAGGILASRVVGFLREMATAYFLGVGAHADVLRTALRMPNVLQNLLGEGTISAAFIPIYSRFLAAGEPEKAGRFAGAILGLLLALVSAAVLAGMLAAPYLVALLAPGFLADTGGALPAGVAWLTDAFNAAGDALSDAAAWLAGLVGLALSEGAAEPPETSPVDRYALSVRAVRYVFPMTGILVLFAWALGVLNSHRRFFVSYFAPVLWNVAILAALFGGAYVWLGDPFDATLIEALPNDTLTRLLFALFAGALAGSVLQFLLPLPQAFRLMRGFRLSFSTHVDGVREALRAFGPVVAGRGVYQLSTYLDLFLASLLAAGAVAALGFAQMLYILPISLFGMSVAASELPELSRLKPDEAASFLGRVDRSMRQMLFMVVPTLVGYLGLGLLIVQGLFERGNFNAGDSWLVYTILASYALGLPATTAGRLLQNSFYALGDTVTPAKIAVARVAVSTLVAVPLMFRLDQVAIAELAATFTAFEAGVPPLYLGAVGLALGASVGGWTELLLLRRALRRKLAAFHLPVGAVVRMTGIATLALAPAAGLWWLLAGWPSLLVTALVTGTFGLTYLGAAHLLGFEEGDAWTGRLLRRG